MGRDIARPSFDACIFLLKLRGCHTLTFFGFRPLRVELIDRLRLIAQMTRLQLLLLVDSSVDFFHNLETLRRVIVNFVRFLIRHH